MFSFEKTVVYRLAFAINRKIYALLKANSNIPIYIKNQLSRASLSLLLNIAEGSGKFSSRDRKNFLIISRASLFECVSIVQFLYEENEISEAFRNDVYNSLEDLSRKLFYMIKRLEN